MFIIPLSYGDSTAAFQSFADDRTAVLLDSAAQRGSDRYSIIAAEPVSVIVAMADGVRVDERLVEGDPFTVLQDEWRKHKKEFDAEMPAPFCGGVVGYFGYELAGYLERLPTPRSDTLELPLMAAGIYDTVAVFDHHAKRAWVISHADDAAKAETMAHKINNAASLPPLNWTLSADWRPELTRHAVEANIRKVRDYIFAGDVFQANYTQRYMAERPVGLSDFDVYRRLRQLSPAPYAAFLRCGAMSVVSASPERFLSLDADGHIKAEPIKGTRARSQDPRSDALLAEELRESAKDNAENLMIVDLMRSDIGRVAKVGSVHVPRLCRLETFASVHHLVSVVEGDLREGLDAFDLLRATFPGGSITGAPKIRAMEIIRELEPSPRGVYCGCLGWIGFDGAMDMSMVIRTLTIAGDNIVAQAGGGIVADSDPVAEYEESLIKITPLLRAVTGNKMGNEGTDTDEALAKQRAG